MEKQFGDLSQFKGRDVELFRSSDLKNTAIYFTDGEYEYREKAAEYFELLRFGLEGGDHQIYIRFPKTDYFVEMIEGGFGSGRGDMMDAQGKNVWEDKHKSPFRIYSHGNNLILLIGRDDWTPEFNFMKKAASYDKGNPFNSNYPIETCYNIHQIEEALSMKFLKIPEDVRRIQYCFKTKDENPKYFLVDSPAYNVRYNNHRFFIIENEIPKEFEIKKFTRYRDGGTTIITLIDENGIEHKFFSPQSMFGKTLVEKWDEEELIEATEEEKQKLATLLELELEPVLSEED